MSPTTYTPSLPGLVADDNLDTIINWGAGADSTAYLAKMLTAPDAHGIDLDRTVMATGGEWPRPGSWLTSVSRAIRTCAMPRRRACAAHTFEGFKCAPAVTRSGCLLDDLLRSNDGKEL
ncbi:hypothetical protein ABZT51_32010 [Streptomyces sp. NPDC005373]|uniref:hypothetical protein n=1 Tax=Streptomyces sp. NPDC005373 TaxID=3156879 RepID=UPI0033AAF3B7